MFIAAMCTIARKWKPPKCLQPEEYGTYTYNGILLSLQKEENWFVCRDVAEPGVCLTD